MKMRHDPTVGLDGILGGVLFHFVSDDQCCAVPYAGLIDYGACNYRESQITLHKDQESRLAIGPADRPMTVRMHWHLPTGVPRAKPTIALSYDSKTSSMRPTTADCRWKAAIVLSCRHLLVVTDLTPREREEHQLRDSDSLGWLSLKEYVGGLVNTLCFDIEPQQWHQPLTFDAIDGFVRQIASHAENQR